MVTKIRFFFFCCLFFFTVVETEISQNDDYNDEEVRQSFREFEEEVRQRKSKLYNSNLECLAEVYSKLLHYLNPTANNEKLFETRLENIKQLQLEYNKESAVFKKAYKSFKNNITMELHLYYLSPEIMFDETKQHIFTEALSCAAAKEKRKLSEFLGYIYKERMKVFDSVPEEERLKYLQYLDIELKNVEEMELVKYLYLNRGLDRLSRAALSPVVSFVLMGVCFGVIVKF